MSRFNTSGENTLSRIFSRTVGDRKIDYHTTVPIYDDNEKLICVYIFFLSDMDVSICELRHPEIIFTVIPLEDFFTSYTIRTDTSGNAVEANIKVWVHERLDIKFPDFKFSNHLEISRAMIVLKRLLKKKDAMNSSRVNAS